MVVISDDPPEGAVGTELEEWRQKLLNKRSKAKMAEARAAMIRRVSNEQLIHLVDRDPMVCWDTLHQVHQAHGFAMRMALRRQFYRAVKSPSESMQLWISRIKALAAKLRHANVKVDDEDVILALTMGLDSSFDPLIISLDTTPPTSLTMEFVIARLLNEETRQGVEEEKTKEVESALVARLGKSWPGGAALKPKASAPQVVDKRSCYRCGEMGHIRAFCKAKAPAEDSKPAVAATAVTAVAAGTWADDDDYSDTENVAF